jgi:hypothetical protein
MMLRRRGTLDSFRSVSLQETVSNLGGMVGLTTADQGNVMKWRVIVELTGSDGTVRSHEVSAGGTNTTECSATTVGLTLADGKRTLAGLQDHLVRTQADYWLRVSLPTEFARKTLNLRYLASSA